MGARKDNYWSGWSDYRYGSGKKVTLAPIFKGETRQRVVDDVTEILRGWRSTPFEHEGSLLAGLRSALCSRGHGWARADAEVRQVVAEGLRRLGAKRPTWEEGQWQHTDSPDYCSWCKAPMDEMDRTRGQRFCSAECAKNTLERRSFQTFASKDLVGRSAYRLIAKLGSKPRSCKQCDKKFQSDRPDALFCSPRCASHHQKGDALLTEIACQWCGNDFMPDNSRQRYCSHSCHGLAHHQQMREQMAKVSRICECCSETFTPSHERSIYCSKRCAGVMAKRAYSYRQKVKAQPAPSVIYLTADVLDRLLLERGLRITSDRMAA